MGTRCLTHWNGSWQLASDAEPHYHKQAEAASRDNPQSYHVTQSPMCRRQQQSWRWRWVSRDINCPFHRPDRTDLCKRLQGKRILLYGDSLTQQFFVSLSSMAGEAVSHKRPSTCKDMRHLDCVSVCGSASNETVVCHRAKFGLVLGEDIRPALDKLLRLLVPDIGVHNCTIKPSTVQPVQDSFPSACIRHFDVVIVSQVAHWVGNDGALLLEQCLTSQYSVASDVAKQKSQEFIATVYERQMNRDAAQLKVAIKGAPSTRVFFRTSPMGMPAADLLAPDTPNGTPPIFTAPTATLAWAEEMVARGSSRFNHHLIPRLNALARRAFEELGIMDVEVPMQHRVDGHLDPLHFCLPGPVDFLSETLYNFML